MIKRIYKFGISSGKSNSKIIVMTGINGNFCVVHQIAISYIMGVNNRNYAIK